MTGSGALRRAIASRALRMPEAVQHVGRVSHVHSVGAVGQTSEAVVAAGVGERRADHIASAIPKHDCHAAISPGFAANRERAVGVEVVPNSAGDGIWHRGVIAEVLGQVDAAGDDGD